MSLCTVPEAIEDFKSGKFVIIVDDESRENEGDLVMASRFITPEAVNFMTREARGLICVSMDHRMLDRLEIPMMVPPVRNRSGFGTGFTVSVEAREGVTTGISAHDRARTIQVLADPRTRPADLVTPGHIFPLRAKPGGVLERRGQTEASVDLARLAGLIPSGVICEIMSEDGHMARLPELIEYGKKHDVRIISVEALSQYLTKQVSVRENETDVDAGIIQSAQTVIPTDHGVFRAVVYMDLLTRREHLALCMGDLAKQPPLVRIHSTCLTGDVFGSKRCDCGEQLELALQRIAQEGRGVLIYLRQEGRGIGLTNKIRAYGLQDKGLDTVEANLKLGFPADIRSYKGAAAILDDLGVTSLRLMTNNPEKVKSMEKYHLNVVERIPHEVVPQEFNRDYLLTKTNKLSHMMTCLA